MLEIVICEDNALFLNDLVKSINKVLTSNEVSGQIVFKTKSIPELDHFIKLRDPNVYFLDIDLGTNENGIDLASRIRARNPTAYIVFVTSHFEFCMQAYKVYAFDYIIKPISDDCIEQCLMRLYNNYLAANEVMYKSNCMLSIKSGSALHKILQKDVIYIERLGFRTMIYTVCSHISCYDSLDSIEEKLDHSVFFRCHKSYIINLLRIKKIDHKNKKVDLQNDYQCSIGSTYKRKLMELV